MQLNSLAQQLQHLRLVIEPRQTAQVNLYIAEAQARMYADLDVSQLRPLARMFA